MFSLLRDLSKLQLQMKETEEAILKFNENTKVKEHLSICSVLCWSVISPVHAVLALVLVHLLKSQPRSSVVLSHLPAAVGHSWPQPCKELLPTFWFPPREGAAAGGAAVRHSCCPDGTDTLLRAVGSSPPSWRNGSRSPCMWGVLQAVLLQRFGFCIAE